MAAEEGERAGALLWLGLAAFAQGGEVAGEGGTDRDAGSSPGLRPALPPDADC